jgi:hypothetical protein
MDAAKSQPSMSFDAITNLIKADQALPRAKQPNAAEPGADIVEAGATSIAEIDKLMAELQTARDYLQAEGERVRRMNARYAHLTSTASASVKIIAESMGKWRTTEIDATTGAGTEMIMRRSHASPLRSVQDEAQAVSVLSDNQARN